MKIDAGLLVTDMKQVAARVRELEETGFDGCFTFEGPHEPFMPLVLAAEHSKLEVGTGLAIAFARTPMTVANLAHDLQQFSGGRLWLGLGSQIKPHIEARYSMPWGKPVSRMKEFVQALRAILASWNDKEKLDFRGEFYTHTLMPPIFNPGPAKGGAPPIYLGGVGPKMTEAAGEVADGMLLHPFHTERSLQDVMLPSLTRGLTASGRELSDFTLCAQVLIVTGENEAAFENAKAMARNQVAFYASTPAYRTVLEAEGYGELQPELRRLTKEGRWQEMANLIDDELLLRIAAVGTPNQVAEILHGRYDTLVERLGFASPFPLPRDCAAEVIQQLRSRSKTA
ncbi:MAG: TIGR03617 family F420-dependent LLM class oxidoreductase [Deltaproteobacteria bacterium]|nr:TIGR03617 family F420-dependent LLM class oxidoreductase [Deltaproteobacteria bacterium]NND30181.1 TIGR03617 family F420-dependent LLM class oxidoreductase [Myxococcales bacterium]MBT8464956.1 TIGR03617 family F420-dependent LLM class oxidoreductase [Deltaproteobacteria bacterium]MBT8480444.1 TIGR03617 family F420-dependent LLM class oxidoreductase [Deltaproteobacteria bacterium]NNK07294.1 TIGR03617 family F420-dependent LLM class oxidoreductase [Myxococcales bacterium]